MARYPDYLMEFDEIAALARWQRAIVLDINPWFSGLLSNLKLQSFSSGRLEELVYDNLGTDDEDDIKLLHKRFTVTTLEVLEGYIRIWLPENKASIEYDKDTLTVKIKVKRDTDSARRRKLTRNILPCNLALEIEAVEELG